MFSLLSKLTINITLVAVVVSSVVVLSAGIVVMRILVLMWTGYSDIGHSTVVVVVEVVVELGEVVVVVVWYWQR